MTHLSDYEIAQQVEPQPITQIAAKLGIDAESIECYGKYKAKLPLDLIDLKKVKNAKLVLVTALSPTPPGEGKTTVSIGLTDGLARVGKKVCAVLREPSLGPVFGMKGGATGGGHAQVIPMEDINLHFTGDFSALEKANNLLAALVDNHLHWRQGGPDLDPRTVVWKRCMDMNDRSLRQMVVGLGGKTGGVPREAGFNITAASEVMAILCLANDPQDLKERLGAIYIGDTYDKKPVYARDLGAVGGMAVLLKDAIKPNLVQTLEGNPAILHGGPFANIAQGTNSVLATRMGLSLADYVVTEAGFGADLGAEKFIDIKCRNAGLSPSAILIVATIRALKYHGGMALSELTNPGLTYLEQGLPNLEKHLENCALYGVPTVVAINVFPTDSAEEIAFLTRWAQTQGQRIALCEGWAHGGSGCEDLARHVVDAADACAGPCQFLYELDQPIGKKIEALAKQVYGADGVQYQAPAVAMMKRIEELGLAHLPICIAKTQYSFSDDPSKLGRPRDFQITVRDIELAAGAGFIVVITGTMLRMPGLPKKPAALAMDIDPSGKITGLF